ncbi:MAG: hypothetical protein EBS06_05630 [Proteobacteria bacterium]|nr:hypothetical protein [Pseudomonadota bacterium]
MSRTAKKLVVSKFGDVGNHEPNPFKFELKGSAILRNDSPNCNQKSKRLVLWFRLTKNDQEVVFVLKGQKAKTLKALIEKGDKGCTALEISKTFALRLSEYIRALRRDCICGGYNLNITTNKEPNPVGWHGRYLLNDDVELLENDVFGGVK